MTHLFQRPGACLREGSEGQTGLFRRGLPGARIGPGEERFPLLRPQMGGLGLRPLVEVGVIQGVAHPVLPS
jgi:hypothetical protein